jgi:hypothetical protein
MRKVVLALLVMAVAAVAGCSGVPIGPVDHSCHVNPHEGYDDSGCS